MNRVGTNYRIHVIFAGLILAVAVAFAGMQKEALAQADVGGPVAVDDTGAAGVGGSVTINVVQNDTDPAGKLQFQSNTDTNSGDRLTCTSAGVCTAQNSSFFARVTTFEYTVFSRATGKFDTGKVTVTFGIPSPPGNPGSPDAVDDDAVVDHGEPIEIVVLQNDSPASNTNPVDVAAVTPTTNGEVTCTRPGICTYTPRSGYSGQDSFIYRITDRKLGTSDTATVNISVTAEDTSTPAAGVYDATDDTGATRSGVPVRINLTQNDKGPNDERPTGYQLTNPTRTEHGYLDRIDSDTVEYTPSIGFAGEDTFTYKSFLDDGTSAQANVTVKVEDAIPVPSQPGCTRLFDFTGSRVSIKENMIRVFFDAEFADGEFGLQGSEQSNNASLSGPRDNYTEVVKGAGQREYVRYIREGVWAFRIFQRDGAQFQRGSVVAYECPAPPLPDPSAEPIGQKKSVKNNYGGGASIDPFVSPRRIDLTHVKNVRIAYAYNGYDDDTAATAFNAPSSSLLTYSNRLSPGDRTNPLTQGSIDDFVDIPITPEMRKNGYSFTSFGVFSGTNSENGNNFIGDGGVAYASEISVEFVTDPPPPPANKPPVAVDDTATTRQDESVIIPVLDNDSDPDGDRIEIEGLASNDQDLHGSLSISNGQIRFTPNQGYSGKSSFSYTIRDARGAISNSATVTISVTPDAPPPVPPKAVDDRVTTDENKQVSFNVLDNDTDPNGQKLTVFANQDPKNGKVTCGDNGGCVYTPNRGFSGSDSFEYVIENEDGAKDSAIVNITVRALPNPPPPPPPDPEPNPEPTPTPTPVPSELRSCARLPGADGVLGARARQIRNGTYKGKIIRPRPQADNVRGTRGNDVILVQSGAYNVTGGGGNDLILYSGSGATNVRGDAGNDFVCLFSGAANGAGGSGNDVLHGNKGASNLDPGRGKDKIYGTGVTNLSVKDGQGGDWLTYKGRSPHNCSSDPGDRVRGC